jgi:hypothetical protein
MIASPIGPGRREDKIPDQILPAREIVRDHAARAWDRWLSKVVRVVRPPITDPASAEIADI